MSPTCESIYFGYSLLFALVVVTIETVVVIVAIIVRCTHRLLLLLIFDVFTCAGVCAAAVRVMYSSLVFGCGPVIDQGW